MTLIKQSTADVDLVFFMADSTDHVTGKTGLSPTVTLSKNGAAFAAPAGAVSEIGNGFYKVAKHATDSNTLGTLALYATATGADPAAMAFFISAFDPRLASMGLSLAKTTNITGFNDIAATAIVSSGAINTSSGAVSNVGTVATLSGHTAQTGDAFARIGATGSGLTSLAPAATALSDAVWTGAKAAFLDAAITSRMATFTYTAPDNAGIAAVQAKTDNLPASPAATGDIPSAAAISTEVWGAETRTLTSAGSGGATAQEVWEYATRTLSAFSFTPTPSNAADTTAIKAKTDNLPASPAAVGSAMTLTSGERTSIGTAVWATTTRSLTTFGTLVSDIWAAATRTLSAFSFTPTPSNAAEQTAIKAKTDLLPAAPADEATLTAMKGATFNTATDSLEAIRDRGDAAWTTGGGGGGSGPTAEEIADAVWDELLAGHAITGSTGAALTASGASGDPWATVLPAAYDDGTAGAAIGRLNNTPPAAPVIVIPDPADDASVCTAYLYTEDLANAKIEGLVVKFTLGTLPAKSERALVKDAVVLTTDADGYGAITLQKDQAILVNCSRLGWRDVELTLTTDVFNLADLIP